MSVTAPTHATLLTGLSPLGHGLGLRKGRVISPRVTTMAQSAAWAGSMTACFRNTRWISPLTGLSRGFHRSVWRRLPATTLAEEAIDWLADAGQVQWFLTLHVDDPMPLHEPEAVDLAELPPEIDLELVARLAMLDSRPGAAESQAAERRASSIQQLREAFECNFRGYDRIKNDRGFDFVRQEPEFQELMRGK